MTPRRRRSVRCLSWNGATIRDDPDSENSLFSEPMKICTPSPRSASPQQLHEIALGLEIVEQLADARQVLQSVDVLEQVGLAAHDQALLLAECTRPGGKPSLDNFLRQLVELGLCGGKLGLDARLGLAERQAADAGIEVVGGLRQAGGRQPGRQRR